MGKKLIGKEEKTLLNKANPESIPKVEPEGMPEVNPKDIDLISSAKDQTKKKKKSNLITIYDYWVIIKERGKKIKDFGVKKDTIDGNDVLVRKENINGQNKYVFCELFPRSKFDLKTIQNNKVQIKKELNKFKQIEKKLMEDEYDKKSQKKEYNFELADIKKEILKREIELDSIKFGDNVRYFHEIRDDKLETLFYERTSNGLELLKEVVNSNIITTASEVKRINSGIIKKEIEARLPKKKDKDWKKLAWIFINVLATIGYCVGSYHWVTYNDEKAFKSCNEKMSALMDTANRNIENNFNAEEKQYYDKIIAQNQDILKQCLENKINPGGKEVYS